MPVEARPLTFQEALDVFKVRRADLHPSFSWKDVSAEEHGARFTVAKSTGFDILKDIAQSLEDAQAGGLPFEQWAKQIRPTLEAKGWWGRKAVIDPADGQVKQATLGTPRRLKTIFDVNMRVSHAAGRWAQIQRVKDRRPYLLYSSVLDRRTRPQHKSWNGIVRPVDDDFWSTHYPPNGWRCRCSVRQLGPRDLAREGLEVSPEQHFQTTTFTNDRTGEVSRVPVGIDPGWAHNPGKLSREAGAAREFAAKWADGPPEMVAAIESANRRQVLPGLAREFGTWAEGYQKQVDAARNAKAAGKKPPPILSTGERRVVGALSQPVLNALAGMGKVPQSGALTINDRAIVHMLRDAKKAGLTIDQVKQLPELLADPKAVLWDNADPALVYVFDPGAGRGKFVVRVDFAERVNAKGGRYTVVTNAVTTGGLVKPADLNEHMPGGTVRRYDILEGEV